MQLKKFLLFGLMAAVLPAMAEETADRKTATSLKYVTHELDTRQNKFSAEQNKAMEYTNAAGTVQKRAVTSDLDNGGTDSLPMVGGVNTKLDTKQDDIAAVNDHTAVTYTGTAGNIGQKGIYQTTGTYSDQSDNLIDAKTFNAALKNGLDSEFKCREDNLDPVSNLCWLYTIHNTSPNLFDKEHDVLLCAVETAGQLTPQLNSQRTALIPTKPNTTYTVSRAIASRLRAATFNTEEKPTYNTCCGTIVSRSTDLGALTTTFTTGPDAKWLAVWYASQNPGGVTIEDLETATNTLQIEYGSTATPYMPYMDVYIPQNQN